MEKSFLIITTQGRQQRLQLNAKHGTLGAQFLFQSTAVESLRPVQSLNNSHDEKATFYAYGRRRIRK